MPHPSAVLQPQALVALVCCLVVPGALLVGAASARLGLRPGTAGARIGWMLPTAGFLLLTLVAADLVPDAVGDNAELGDSLLRVLLPAVLTFVAVSLLVWRPSPAGCCSPATGMVTAVALATHGILEGFVVGLGVGVGLVTGLGLLALFACHRFVEGFALATTLQAASRRTRVVLVSLAAVTPLVGGDAGLLATPGPRLSVGITAALAGLLAAAGLRLLLGPSLVALARPAATGPATGTATGTAPERSRAARP